MMTAREMIFAVAAIATGTIVVALVNSWLA
jgi:hypothetical protein